MDRLSSTRNVKRLAVFAFLWWVISEGDPASWVIGLPVIVLATLLSTNISSPDSARLRLVGIARFFPVFVRQSLAGGVDVARRALSPRLPLHPGTLRYPLRLPPGPARIFFVNTVSLLPGTLSAGLEGNRLTLQAMDVDAPVTDGLTELEGVVGALFGVELAEQNR